MNDYMGLGERLKNIRLKKGLNLDEVSAMTGVSKTMLSQIERSGSVPTIATVCKIANGLQIKFDSLLSDPSNLYTVNNIYDKDPMVGDNEKFFSYQVFPFSPSTGFSLFFAILKPGCHLTSETHKNGRTEHLFVCEGEISIIVGEDTYSLKEGSTISFDATEPPTYINSSTSDAKICATLSYE